MKIKKPTIYNGIKPPEAPKKGFWKAVFRIFTVEFASLSILEILLILAIVGGGIFYIKNIFQKSYEEGLGEKIAGLEKCQSDLQKLSEQSAYDTVRISDTTNILLALQDYNFEKANLPKKLEELQKGKYLDGNLLDPEFGKPYYYKKLSPVDYVLCIYLTSGTWGTNISQCPSREEFLGKKKVEIVIISETPTGWLKVRKETSLEAKVLTKVYPGEEYEVLEEKDGWLKIKLKELVEFEGETFDSGWVWKEYTKEKK